MSWQATNWVIEHSKHKGSALLTLLCIANCANESGQNAFPGLPKLARDTRMSLRQVGRIIEKLESSGELVVERSEGRNHRYSFPLMTPDKMSRVRKTRTPDISASTPDILSVTPDIAMSSDPSVRSISKNDHLPARENGYKKPKTPKHQIAEFEDPEILDPEHAFRDYLHSMFPTVPITEFYKKWYLSRFRQGGIKGHLGRAAPLEHYHADMEYFFQICAENGKNGNGHKQPEEEYTGPVRSKPNPKKENCPDCRGMGNILVKGPDGLDYAKVCRHERSGVAAA